MPSPAIVAEHGWEGELINKRKDGTEFPIQLSATSIRNEDGQTIALIAVAQDITERKRVEKTLRESELRYKTLFDAASDSIMILDTEGDRVGRIIAANRAAAEMTGYTTEELLSLSIADLRTPMQASRVQQDIERVLSGEKVTIELLRRRKDGITMPVEINQSVLPLGDKHYVLDFARDLTQRKQIEKEVAMLAQAIRTIHEAVVVTDADANIIFLNDAAVKMFGYEPGEAIGQNVTLFRAGHDSAFVSAILGGAKSENWEGETLSRRKNGTDFPMYLSASEIRDDSGKFIAFIGVCQDITEQKRSIEELRRAKEAAEAASQAKSEFLANMSHEIRTPMNGIVGMTELALDTELSGEQREYLKLVKLSSDSLLRVINDILDFSKIEAGKLELDHEEFSLQDNVDEVMKALGVRADQKGLELAYYLRAGVPDFIVGDVGRLRQILVNLVGNAIKFTEVGEVIVRVEIESQTDDQVVLHFCVRDTGIGVPIEKQAIIFESFTQADGSTTRKYGGTGLGLAISAQLVRAMNGRMWIQSPSKCGSSNSQCDFEKGQSVVEMPDLECSLCGVGSMFHFTAVFDLPMTATVRTSPVELSTLRAQPVLVVDDNATNRRILEVQLATWEMTPITVATAAEALDAIRRAAGGDTPFKLVLTDLHMPDVDGAQLAELIRRAPEAADLKIIMMSSAVRENYNNQELGVDAYLTKPVKASDLVAVIRSVLGKAVVSQNVSNRPHAISSPHPARVLVAEDSAVNQELMKRLLIKWGHSVVIAGNGKIALSLLDAERFDVVLMDIQMPEINGFEATQAIRSKERGTDAHVPIIALTAHALKGDRERCIDAGMDDYVSKPIQADKLFAAIEDAIARAGMSNSNGHATARVLDADALMLNLDGDIALLQALAEIFTTSAPTKLSELEDAISRHDAEAIMRGAHTIKGSVATFQARAAVDAAAVLEKIGDSGDLSNANPAFGELSKELKRLTQGLNEFIGRVVK
ncbi:MAG TPA: PAS domain S-box protein, partial [Blastocatellia bacterium]|nr:PAS domain S-box protein [Blastocatellia bacterium]